MATLLIRFTQTPYSSATSHDGLVFALAATNYGHEVKILLENQAVLQLVKTESAKGLKNHSKRLASLPFFDIEDCYVCKDSADTLGIVTALDNRALFEELECQWVSAAEKLTLIQSADHVVTF